MEELFLDDLIGRVHADDVAKAEAKYQADRDAQKRIRAMNKELNISDLVNRLSGDEEEEKVPEQKGEVKHEPVKRGAFPAPPKSGNIST